MEKRSLFLKVFLPAIVVIMAVFCVYEFFFNDLARIKTETVVQKTAAKTIEINVFAVRDEEYLVQNGSGIPVPLIEDGNRVAKGNAVAAVCANSGQADSLKELMKCREELKRYERLASMRTVNAFDVKKMDGEIDLLFNEVLSSVSSGRLELLGAKTGDLRDKLTGRQIAVGANVDFNAGMTAVKEKLALLEEQVAGVYYINTETPGYFIGKTDGYEKTIPFGNIGTVTAEQIESAVESAPSDTPVDVIGKLVGDYNWYLLASLKDSDASQLQTDQTVKLYFGQTEENKIDVRVHSIRPSGDGKTAVVFRCNMMNKDLSAIRIESAHLIVSEYTGLKINTEALRVQDGVKGVFIRRGNIISFRKLNIIYTEPDFVIANESAKGTDTEKKYKHVKLFDEVLVKGKDLYDGKIID